MQNSQKILGLPLWTPMGSATGLQGAPRLPSCATDTSQKLVDMTLGRNICKKFLRIFLSGFFRSTMNKKRNKIDYHFKP